MLCYSSIACLGYGLTHSFINMQISIYYSFCIVFSSNVPARCESACMVDGIMDLEGWPWPALPGIVQGEASHGMSLRRAPDVTLAAACPCWW